MQGACMSDSNQVCPTEPYPYMGPSHWMIAPKPPKELYE